jgi:hypothetical protein
MCANLISLGSSGYGIKVDDAPAVSWKIAAEEREFAETLTRRGRAGCKMAAQT